MTIVRWVVSSLFGVAAGLVLLLYCSAAQAITVPLSLSELTGLADTVVLGTVVSNSSHWNAEHNNIYTEVLVSVVDSLKGSADKKTIVIIAQGGTVGEITQWVEDTATFEPGEQVGLFLEDLNSAKVSQMELDSVSQISANGSAVRIIGGLQGKLSLAKDSLSGGGGISADKFKQNVQKALAGQAVPEDEHQHFPEAKTSNVYDISTISPASASAGTNTIVTVTGSGFGTTRGQSDNLEFFMTTSGGSNYYLPAITYISWSDTQIQAYVPVCNNCSPSNGYPYSAASGPVRVVKGDTLGSLMDFTVTFGYGSIRWPGDSPNISYKVNDGGVAGRSAAIQAGATSWTNAGSKFEFSYGGAHTQTVKSYNGVNEILWMSLPAGILGQATIWFSDGEIVECDFAFATAYTWSYASTCPSGQYDIQSVGTHEMGHWLNLRDLYGNYTGFTQDTAKVMFGRSSGSGTIAKRILHAHDILGVRWIYGIQPPTPTPTPTPSPTPSPSPTSTPTPTPSPSPSPSPTVCTATLDGNLLLHIPYLSYNNPMLGTISLWVDLLYEFNPEYSTLIFKYLKYGINNPFYSCAGSTLSADLKIHIPDVLLPDGSTHLWVDLEYCQALSTDKNAYFSVIQYGAVSN